MFPDSFVLQGAAQIAVAAEGAVVWFIYPRERWFPFGLPTPTTVNRQTVLVRSSHVARAQGVPRNDYDNDCLHSINFV
jgi:hypothetical protein